MSGVPPWEPLQNTRHPRSQNPGGTRSSDGFRRRHRHPTKHRNQSMIPSSLALSIFIRPRSLSIFRRTRCLGSMVRKSKPVGKNSACGPLIGNGVNLLSTNRLEEANRKFMFVPAFGPKRGARISQFELIGNGVKTDLRIYRTVDRGSKGEHICKITRTRRASVRALLGIITPCNS